MTSLKVCTTTNASNASRIDGIQTSFGIYTEENILTDVIESASLGNTAGVAPQVCETFTTGKDEFVTGLQGQYAPTFISRLLIRSQTVTGAYGATATT